MKHNGNKPTRYEAYREARKARADAMEVKKASVTRHAKASRATDEYGTDGRKAVKHTRRSRQNFDLE